MSQWCNTCSLGKVNGRYESCTEDCPAFGKTLEELAEVVIKQREEIDALRWTNKQLIKVEKQKRIELWKKAVNQFLNKVRQYQKPVCFAEAFVAVDVEDIEMVAKEMIKNIKE